MITHDRIGRFVVVAALDTALLIALTPDWAGLGRQLSHPARWVSAVGADNAAATLAGAALWLCAAWVGLGLALALATTAPGAVGSFGSRLVRLVLPPVLLRLVLGVAGASLTLAVAAPAAGALAPTGPSSAGPVAVSATAASPAIPWPTNGASPSLTLGWPMTKDAAGSAAAQSVTVAPGDCLWDLAAAQLAAAEPVTPPDPGRIAGQVQLWYAANRAVIGPDPGLLHPGQVLLTPTILRP